MHEARWVAALAAAGAVALAGTAAAQDSAWGYFEADEETDGVRLMQAGVVAPDGSQLILKCDKPGANSVVAAVATQATLAPPQTRPPVRKVRMRFDGGTVEEATWRFYPNTAMASNVARERTLPRFVAALADARQLDLVLDPVDGPPVNLSFNVAGAREAIGRIYERCKDRNPLS